MKCLLCPQFKYYKYIFIVNPSFRFNLVVTSSLKYDCFDLFWLKVSTFTANKVLRGLYRSVIIDIFTCYKQNRANFGFFLRETNRIWSEFYAFIKQKYNNFFHIVVTTKRKWVTALHSNSFNIRADPTCFEYALNRTVQSGLLCVKSARNV